MRVSAAVLVLAATGSACWVPLQRGKEMESRIQRLEDDAAVSARQLEDQRQAVRERIARVDQKIAEVQRKLDELNATAHRTGADLAVSLDKLGDQLRALHGDLESEQHRLQDVSRALAAFQSDTDARFSALKGQGALDEYEARRKLEGVPRPADKAGFLALARKEEESGDRAVARQLYQEFARKWPADPATAEAHLHLGELYFADRRYRDAILSFGKVAEDFPRSERAPEALLRMSDSMLQLQMKDQTKPILDRVIERYPQSAAAEKAKARLAELFPAPPEKPEPAPAPTAPAARAKKKAPRK